MSSLVAAFFARAFFEPALAAIGTNLVESTVAGSNEVRPAVVGLSVGAGSVDAGLFITHLIFGAGVPVGGAFGDFDAFLEGEGGQLAAFLLRTRGQGIVGVLVEMVRTKFSRFFFMGFC